MTNLKHHDMVVEGIKWHWVEAGDGDPVILLHGIPESWQCWNHQIDVLSKQFRVLAFDMKGYGDSDKKDDDYTGPTIAKQMIALFDQLGIKEFRLAGHDWGVFVCDHIVDQASDRVEQYVRCCLSLHRYDPKNAMHHQWISTHPDKAARLMSKAGSYVRVWIESACKPELIPSEDEIRSIINDFDSPGTSECVPKYFRDLAKSTPVDYSKFTMSTLYIHGEFDPRQPVEYCYDMEKYLPGLEAILVLDSGHFVTRERPKEVSRAMSLFFNRMLAPGVSLFKRSKELGLPVKPAYDMGSWGLNSFEDNIN